MIVRERDIVGWGAVRSLFFLVLAIAAGGEPILPLFSGKKVSGTVAPDGYVCYSYTADANTTRKWENLPIFLACPAHVLPRLSSHSNQRATPGDSLNPTTTSSTSSTTATSTRYVFWEAAMLYLKLDPCSGVPHVQVSVYGCPSKVLFSSLPLASACLPCEPNCLPYQACGPNCLSHPTSRTRRRETR